MHLAVIRRIMPAAGIAIAAASSVLLGGVALGEIRGIPLGNLTRDPANILEFPFYYGAISYSGILMWCATATMCLFSWLALQGAQSERGLGRFFLASGVLTGFLLFDDLFLFHEKFFPVYLGVPEQLTFSFYICVVLTYLFSFHKTLLQLEFPLLLIAGAFLGASMGADRVTDLWTDTSAKFLLEDGLKFTGITFWFTFFLRTCLTNMRVALGRPAVALAS